MNRRRTTTVEILEEAGLRRELFVDDSARELAKLRYTAAVESAVLDAMVEGVVVVDERRRVVRYNDRFVELCGADPVAAAAATTFEEMVAVALVNVVDPGALRAEAERLMQTPLARHDGVAELRDGTAIEHHSAPVVDAAGAVRGRVWFLRDVTAQRRAEARLREANRFLDSIVENIPSLVAVRDARDQRLLRINRASEELLGVRRADVLGRVDFELAGAAVASLPGRGGDDESVRSTATRGVRRLRTRRIPIADAGGDAAYLLELAEDITDERRREAELYLAKERAEDAARGKSEFLANMSHELRTPLNAILGFGRLLRRDAPLGDAERRAFAGDVVHAAEHMLALVDDLLELRGLEAGDLPVAPVALGAPLGEAVRMVRPLIDERRHALELDVPAALPALLGERRALVQILVNLLGNAAKFTPPGGHLAIRAAHDGAWVHVSVVDDGPGIAPEGVARLFTYFQRLNAKHDLGLKGSGIGLALTRALVEKLGGTITVASALGHGATFRFSLRSAS